MKSRAKGAMYPGCPQAVKITVGEEGKRQDTQDPRRSDRQTAKTDHPQRRKGRRGDGSKWV